MIIRSNCSFLHFLLVPYFVFGHSSLLFSSGIIVTCNTSFILRNYKNICILPAYSSYYTSKFFNPSYTLTPSTNLVENPSNVSCLLTPSNQDSAPHLFEFTSLKYFLSYYISDTTNWLRPTRGIRDILEDEQGNLWFSSPDYLAQFDGTDLIYFGVDEGLEVTGNMHIDESGQLWVENGFRAFRLEGNRFQEYPLNSMKGANRLYFQRGLNPADSTYRAPGFYEVNYNTTTFYSFPIEESADNKYLYFPTTKIINGKDSTLWMGTMEKVFGYIKGSFISIGREEMGRQNDELQMGIRDIYEDQSGKLWMADNGAGVFIYDGKEVINITEKYNLYGLQRAFSIAEDAQGLIWIGTVYSGVWNFNPQTDEWTNYTSKSGVESENIWTIYLRKSGQLLFAGESPGAVYTFSGSNFERVF